MSQSITFLVAVPPMLWIPHQLVGAPLDHAVTLECYTEAHPTSLNYWTREDGLMIQGSKKYKTTSTPEKPSYKTHMTLTIHDLQVGAAGFPFLYHRYYRLERSCYRFFTYESLSNDLRIKNCLARAKRVSNHSERALLYIHCIKDLSM
ncbi:hypothetical protein K0M31_001671 [Melipona bicolor]|uniref:Ig-like domain-containing protein n=1 Tax=Melipona bicolor TaxID=60889 RepID=A0AA40GFZ7_9HYME|nr:hypothetical protein K0M31_001671 [Melipona bicolor]